MKQWFKQYFQYNQNIIALCMALLAAISLCLVLFASPRPGCVDMGEYDQTLYRMGLARTAEDIVHPENRYFVKAAEEFRTAGVDSARLIGATPTESLIYPVALISSLCNLFGVNFSTFYLAILFAVIVVISLYIITKSLYFYLGNKAVAAGVLFCFFMLSSDNTVYFNSLYSNGMVTVSFIFMTAMILRGLTNETRKGLANILPALGAAYLFLTSTVSMPFLAVVVLPVLIWLLYKNLPPKEKRYSYYIISLGGLALLTGMCLHFIQRSEQLNAKMNLYTATFNGAFALAEDPEEALRFFGLPAEYQADIGKSYYLEESRYQVAPYTEEAEELLYSKISYGKLFQYYLSHPQTFFKLLDTVLSHTQGVERDKFMYVEKNGKEQSKETVERLGYYPLVRKLIVPVSAAAYLTWSALLTAAAVGLILFNRHRNRKAGGYGIFLFLVLLSMGSLVVNGFLYGNFDAASHLYGYIIMSDAVMIGLGVLIIYGVCELSRFLNWEEKAEEAESPYVISDHDPGHFLYRKLVWLKELFVKQVLSSSRNTTIFMGLLATLIIAGVLFFPDRIGAYNNGDFGRMMDAMGLYYNEYDLLHQEEQYVTKVHENYVWLDNFDWATVTPISPSMSQTMLAVFVKLTAGVMGFGYSTVYATVIYMALLGFSFGAFVWGAYQLMGRKAVGLAAALIVVLFGSYNLGWFNSLFSEATEMAGLLMVLGTSMVLIAKEKGTVGWKWWLAFLFSIRFFIGGKAQVTPEILLLAPWAVILAFYHRPPKAAKWVVQIVLVVFITIMTARSALIIYQKNNLISSGDTTYASIFAGVLVVADDPVVALEELGLDTSLVADAGKHQYLPKEDYYCPPRTEKAEEMVYSKIDAIGVLKWYLVHPKALWEVLDYTAQAAADTMPDFFLYVGEKTTQEHRTVSKFNIWEAVRGGVTPNAFWQYIVLYSAFIIFCGKKAFSKKEKDRNRLLAAFFILLILVGAMQFPLTVIGNGFVDNVKQLFVFRLAHDIIMVSAIFYGCVWLRNKIRRYEK